MAGHLILVVHGIGEQEPSKTVDSVLAGALADHERADGDRPVIVTSDHLTLPERAFPRPSEDDAGYDTQRQVPHFPLHLRHVTERDGDGPATTLAEVFWADKSPAPKGFFPTLLDFARTLLGTGYLAIENAKSTGSAGTYGLVLIFVLLFFSVIPAINTMLLVGLGVLVLYRPLGEIGDEGTFWPVTGLAQAGPEQLVLLTGVLTVVLGTLLRQFVAKTQLVTQYAWGLIAVGIVTAVYGVFTLYDAALGFEIVDTPEFTYLGRFVQYAVNVIGYVWLAALVLCLVLHGFGARMPADPVIADGKENAFDDPEAEIGGFSRIYAPISSALILFWLVFGSAFWVFAESVAPLGIDDRPELGEEKGTELTLSSRGPFDIGLAEELGGMAVAVFCFVLVLAVVVGVAIARHKQSASLHLQKFAGRRRLLLNAWVQGAFTLTTLLITAIVLYRVLLENMTMGPVWFQAGLDAVGFFVTLLDKGEVFANGVLLALALAISYFVQPLGNALGVIRDITVYATTQKAVGLKNDALDTYLHRDEIERRLDCALSALLSAKQPERLTILSHSLGTVVATRCLGRMLPTLPDNMPITLITMGSPVTHIYRRYFPRNFDVAGKIGASRVAWVNIFRTDDFVGTWVSGLDRTVGNFHVPAGGHSGYFTDGHVWTILRGEAKLTLLPPSQKARPPEAETPGGEAAG